MDTLGTVPKVIKLPKKGSLITLRTVPKVLISCYTVRADNIYYGGILLITDILFLLLLVMINAFFAASEIALISLNDNKIKIMAEEGHKKAKILVALLSEPSRFLATIQIGITMAGFLASAFAAENFSDQLVTAVKNAGIAVPEAILKSGSLFIITIVLSYFTLVLGELVPKRLAMKKPEPISFFVARPIQVLMIVTNPFVKFLTFSMNLIVSLLGVNPHEEDKSVTEEEIRMMVDVGEEKGTIDESEKWMINNIFEFNNKIVTDIMTHRTDIVALPTDSTLEEIITLINEEKYSRIPIYEENIDNITGILHAKDVMTFITTEDHKSFKLSELIRRPYFIPCSKRIDILLKEFQLHKTHLAIIIDEYGGTEGLVTLEDLLEEIVGNIFDEDDEVEKEIEALGEGIWKFNGSVSLDEAALKLGIDLPIDDYETLGGFIIGQLGFIPETLDFEPVQYEHHEFTVLEIEEKKIELVLVKALPQDE